MGQGEEDINGCISNTQLVFIYPCSWLWSRQEIKLVSKIWMCQDLFFFFLSILLYCCVTWPMRAEDLCILEVFGHHCLHCIFHIYWQQFISNFVVHARFKISSFQLALLTRYLCWFGHTRYWWLGDFIHESSLLTGLEEVETWFRTMKLDVELILGLHLYRICCLRWVPTTCSSVIASDCYAWSSFIRTWWICWMEPVQLTPKWMLFHTHAHTHCIIRFKRK